jgi:hypothetical protein
MDYYNKLSDMPASSVTIRIVKRYALLFSLLLMISAFVVYIVLSTKKSLTSYVNSKYSYSVSFPKYWEKYKGRENAEGRVFYDEGESRIAVRGSEQIFSLSTQDAEVRRTIMTARSGQKGTLFTAPSQDRVLLTEVFTLKDRQIIVTIDVARRFYTEHTDDINTVLQSVYIK